MIISWSRSSEVAYIKIIDQLFTNWSINIVEKFKFEVDELLAKIRVHNHICPKSIFENLHKCVVNKHISLIYRVHNDETIEIVTFIFNESDHIFY